MSLDVYLEGEPEDKPCWCCHCGHEHVHSEAPEYYSRNITHNLTRMAEEAGLYEACWRPDENGISQASELVPLLARGLALLESDPERFRAFNPENGWGTYEGLVEFVRDYLEACQQHPEAFVRACR